MIITQAKLKELLDYDPSTGIFRWKVDRKVWAKAGDVAGSINSWGYIVIHTIGRLYKAHRLAWLWVHGTWPPGQLDHANGDRTDNRIVNLRPATQAENQRNRKCGTNNSTGYKGVSLHHGGSRYFARIRVGGKQTHLGCFASAPDAHAAYATAAQKHYGQFARSA